MDPKNHWVVYVIVGVQQPVKGSFLYSLVNQQMETSGPLVGLEIADVPAVQIDLMVGTD